MTRTIPTEAEEQIAVVQYCDARKLPVFHIPNGGERRAAVANHLKAQGVKAGVPDLFVPIASSGYHGLFIEMKRRSQWRMSDAQTRWIQELRKRGYAAFVCPGAKNAITCIKTYLGECEEE